MHASVARARSSLTLVHMSVYVQMEEGCEVATADEVATVVHQIFAYAAGACC